MKINPTDGILVFDRYYSKKPIPALLAVMKVLFCVAFSVSAMLFVFSQYNFISVSLVFVGSVTAGISSVFSALLIFVKRRYVIAALVAICFLVMLFNHEALAALLSYFLDEMMLLTEGRFLAPRPFLINDIETFSVFNPIYKKGMLLGAALLCGLFSLLCAATMRRRVRIIPAVAVLMILCAPCLIAEELEFNLFLLPVALLIAAGAAIALNYNSGLAVVRSGNSLYRHQIREEEMRFMTNTEGASFLKRISMRICHYSKYASSGMYCAAIFALAFSVGITAFEQGTAISYTEIYEYITDFFSDEPDVSDEQDEPIANYFSSPDREEDGLSITSPGRGTEPVLKVTFSGDNSIYLRGDIGVTFNGSSWITPVNNDASWKEASFSEDFRPAELQILTILMNELGSDAVSVSTNSDVTVEYLCHTDVVFLPAYTADFSHYNNEYFDVYGDYCVRISDTADNYVKSVQCTAYIHDFNMEAEAKIEAASQALDKYGINVSDLYSAYITDTEVREGVLDEYSEYVNDTYLHVPEKLAPQITDYLSMSGLLEQLSEYLYIDNVALYRYKAASAISEYLNENYTYSLSNINRGENAVMQFLNETKSGHCSLYATAMTLMLRRVGIPARYCTGYAVHPQSVSGNVKVLKQRDLHAWVEVYMDDFGWVTFDPTSSDVENLNREQLQETYESSPVQTTTSVTTTNGPSDIYETNEPSYTSETKETQTSPDAGTSDTSDLISAELIAAILAVIFVVLLVAALAWYYNRVRVQAEDLVNRGTSSDKTAYKCMIEILEFFRIVPEAGEFPGDYFLRIDEVLNVGFSEYVNVLEAAAFSADAANTVQLVPVLKKLYSATIHKSSVIKRYRINRIVIKSLKNNRN